MTRLEKKDRLNEMLSLVPHAKFREFQEEIARRSNSSIQTVYNWRTGRTEIPKLVMKEIENVFRSL